MKATFALDVLTSGGDPYARLYKDVDLPFSPSVDSTVADSAWSDEKTVKGVVLALGEKDEPPTLHVYLGEHRQAASVPAECNCEAFVMFCVSNGWRRGGSA